MQREKFANVETCKTQNTKRDDINTPKYEIMIDESNAVRDTVTGTVTRQTVRGTASTG